MSDVATLLAQAANISNRAADLAAEGRVDTALELEREAWGERAVLVIGLEAALDYGKLGPAEVRPSDAEKNQALAILRRVDKEP